jgi:hypothetical protein
MPTIPDEQMPDFVVPESDYRCKSGQSERGKLDPRQSSEAALLTRLPAANRELSIVELLRHPTLLSEHATIGTAAKVFASGMEPPVVLVTPANVPLGLIDPAGVLQLIRGRTVEEIEQTRLLDVITPHRSRLEEDASLLDAAERFVSEDCDGLVVVNRGGQLAGVLMARDLFLLWV